MLKDCEKVLRLEERKLPRPFVAPHRLCETNGPLGAPLYRGALQADFSRRFEMRVQDIMTVEVETCGPESDLAAAANIMWRRDCGSVPVVDADGKVIGMITDRDICMAVSTRNRLASEIKVNEVMSGRVYACSADDDIRDALETMQSAQLRRLPVVDGVGSLQGILSINDVLLHSAKGRSKKHVAHRDVMVTLKVLSEHRRPDAETEQAIAAALL
jgi:CBS domain-containing protein